MILCWVFWWERLSSFSTFYTTKGDIPSFEQFAFSKLIWWTWDCPVSIGSIGSRKTHKTFSTRKLISKWGPFVYAYKLPFPSIVNSLFRHYHTLSIKMVPKTGNLFKGDILSNESLVMSNGCGLSIDRRFPEQKGLRFRGRNWIFHYQHCQYWLHNVCEQLRPI